MPGDPFNLTLGAQASLEGKPTARLVSIAIRNFGPYKRRTELEIRPLTVLCGPNGAGKSTWLRALEWLRENCQSSPTWLASLDEPSSGRLFTRNREDDLPPASALLSLTMDFETWPGEDLWLRGALVGPQSVAQRMHRDDGDTQKASVFKAFLEKHRWAGLALLDADAAHIKGDGVAGRVRVDLHFRPKDRHRRGMKSLAKVSATFLDRGTGVEMKRFSIATPVGRSVRKGPGSDFLPMIQVLLDDALQHSFSVSAVRTNEAGTRAVTDFDGGPPRVHRDGRGTQAILAHLRYALMVPWRAAEGAATQPDGASKHSSDLLAFLGACASSVDEVKPADSDRRSRIPRRPRGAKVRKMRPLDLLRQVARESGFRGLPRGWRAAARKGWTGAFAAILREGGPAWEDKYLGNFQPLLEFWRADPRLRSIGNFVALAVMLSHADRSSSPGERAALLPDALRNEIPELLVKAMEYVTTLQDVASSWISRITGVRMDDASYSSVDQPGLPVIQPVSVPRDLVFEPWYVSLDPAILPTMHNGMVYGRPKMFSEGFHQASPIVVQLLTAKPFATICIENPEVHLHPAAQIAMAELLLAAALGGRHVIVETHSDLIVRRILRAGAETPAMLESIGIYGVSLRWRGKEWAAALECIRRDASGRVMNWPDGFLSDDAEESGRMLAAIARKPATDA